MPDDALRLLVLGAHPDDAEYHAGGLCAIYRQLGHVVKMISVTNGDAGHHEMHRDELATVRRAEAKAAGEAIGAAYVTWDFHDGTLQPTLDVREKIIREIRTFKPDVLLTHRLNDYHPDHRAVGQAVQDASYMVTVPAVCPDTPILRSDPVVAYMTDLFTKPTKLDADVIIDVTDHVDTIVRMLACQTSQVFEWLPYNECRLEEVPEGDAERLEWLRGWFDEKITPRADHFRSEIIAACDENKAASLQYVEVLEVSEYASPLSCELKKKLFPFAV